MRTSTHIHTNSVSKLIAINIQAESFIYQMILIGGNLNALNIDGSHFHIGNDMKLMSTLIVILMMAA